MNKFHDEINLLFESSLNKENKKLLEIHLCELIKEKMISLGFEYIQYEHNEECDSFVMSYNSKNYNYVILFFENNNVFDVSKYEIDRIIKIKEEKLNIFTNADFIIFVDKPIKTFYNIKKDTFFKEYDDSMLMSKLESCSKIHVI
jgi:hypothetical protein